MMMSGHRNLPGFMSSRTDRSSLAIINACRLVFAFLDSLLDKYCSAASWALIVDPSDSLAKFSFL